MFRPHGPPMLRSFAQHGTSRLIARWPCMALGTNTHRPSAASTYRAPVKLQTRGGKTKTTVQLSDLPQGAIAAEPVPLEPVQDGPAYPTVVLQARRHMDKFDNCVLLTRVGGFYELYFEHAEEYAPLLNIKLASKKTSAGPVPMVISNLAQPYCFVSDHVPTALTFQSRLASHSSK